MRYVSDYCTTHSWTFSPSLSSDYSLAVTRWTMRCLCKRRAGLHTRNCSYSSETVSVSANVTAECNYKGISIYQMVSMQWPWVNSDLNFMPAIFLDVKIGLCSILRPLQHSIGYMGDGFYRSKDPTNSIKVLKEATKENKNNTKNIIHTEIVHAKKIRIYNTASPLVYSNMGWLGDGSHRGQVCQAWTAVGLPPWYPQSGCQKTVQHRAIVTTEH